MDTATWTDSEKLVFAQEVGAVLLASGSAVNVASIDLDLPAGFGSFELCLWNGVQTDQEYDADYVLSAALSNDDGVTWLNAADSYRKAAGEGGAGSDAPLIPLTQAPILCRACFLITPGNGAIPAMISAMSGAFTDQYLGAYRISGVSRVTDETEVRMNKLRILNHGTAGSASSPDTNIAALSYALIGKP